MALRRVDAGRDDIKVIKTSAGLKSCIRVFDFFEGATLFSAQAAMQLRRTKVVRCCGKKSCLAADGQKNGTTPKLKIVGKIKRS